MEATFLPLMISRMKIQIQCWVSAFFSLFIISEALLFVSWQELITLRPNRRWAKGSFCFGLKPNLDLLPKSGIIFDREDELSNSLEESCLNLYLYYTEPSRVTTSAGVLEHYFKAINFQDICSAVQNTECNQRPNSLLSLEVIPLTKG